MLSTNIKRSAAALATTAGLLAATAPAGHADSWGIDHVDTVKAPTSSDRWGATWPTYPSRLKADSNEVAVEGVKVNHEADSGTQVNPVVTFSVVTD
jgi:hypothetical protein